MLGWVPDALAVTRRHHTAAALAMLHAAVSAGTPIIEMSDRQPRGAVFVRAGFDHAEFGCAMARHLLDAGHHRLLYADTGVAADFRAHDQGKAILTTARHGGAVARVVTAPDGDAFDTGRAVLADLIDGRGRLNAGELACANDHLAWGAGSRRKRVA